MNPLQNFRLARYRVILTALSPISMPPYAGSTLRGGFGQAFRKMVKKDTPALRVPLTAEIAHSKRSVRIRTSSRLRHSRARSNCEPTAMCPDPL